MAVIFFTGFPGFLGSKLLPGVLKRHPEARAVCLIQSKFASLASRRRDELIAAEPELEGRIELLEGDITVPRLGLAHWSELTASTVEIFHLAAVYDLSVSRAVGMKVNVEGTRNVLDFASECSQLERFQYVSTCYVSGRHCGIFRESDLDKGQQFNNFYEETKFLAEVDVQAHRKNGLPTTIYRPSIVVGDSRTGATQKYDGPYYTTQWLMRQPSFLALMPSVGDPSRVRINLVPSDYVVGAIEELAGLEVSRGKVYQLCDPEPLTGEELLTECARSTGRNVVRISVPLKLGKWLMRSFPLLYSIVRIPADVMDYFVHPTHYTNDHAIADINLEVPRVRDYFPRLIDFQRRHPEGLGAMV